MPTIRRAIISCHDKEGLLPLARLLDELGVEIISTAGTLHALLDAGIHAINMADFTGVKEMLGGRVKSLHPRVHAGLLCTRDNKLHMEQMQEYDFKQIDLVVANLRPVVELVQNPGITIDEVFEQVDIGGAAMLLSAAKNFRYVTVVVNPERYSAIMHELRAHEGGVTFSTRYRLAVEAFGCVADYDRTIYDYLRGASPPAE